MNKSALIVFMGGIFLLVGCQSDDRVASYINVEATERFLDNEKEEQIYPDVGDEDIFDFAFIKGAPEAKSNHEVDDIIKMYAGVSSFDEPHDPIAIDIEKSEIYQEPSIRSLGVDIGDEHRKVDDIDELVELFDTYDVLNWQHYYSDVKDYHSYEDGISWSILIQYSDGSIDEFRGEGMSFKDIIPENYDDFMGALEEYVVKHVDT